MDMGEAIRGWLKVDDLKTTSDFRYCKTEEQLAENTQMITYAQWGYEVYKAEVVSVAHIYGRTKGKARGHKVSVDVSRELVAEQWAQRVKTIREMVGHAATIESADELPPDTSHCMDYGGCAFRSKCGFTAFAAVKPSGTFAAVKPKVIKTGGVSMGSELLKQLRAAKGNLNGAVNGAAPPSNVTPIKGPAPVEARDSAPEKCSTCKGTTWAKSDAPGAPIGAFIPCQDCKATGLAPTGIVTSAPDAVLPPDAPSRTTTPEEITAVESAKRGRPKKVKEPEVKKMKMKVEGVLYECEFDADGNELSRVPLEVTKHPLSNDQLLSALGFTPEEIVKLEARQETEDALKGEITPGMLRQPKSIEKTIEVKAVPVAPAPKRVKPASPEKTENINQVLELLKEKRGAQVRPVPAVPPVLYIDCMPVKGSINVVSMEEWLGPIAELAALANEVQDVRLISYTSKGVLASAIRDCLDTTPAALLIDSRQFGADEVLAALIPHASLVVRGIR
jgi:hypothetical protein